MSSTDIIKQTVKSYTLNAAWYLDHDDTTGSIEVGKFSRRSTCSTCINTNLVKSSGISK